MQTINLVEGEQITPVTPSKIICVGRNYLAHIQELNNPVPDEMVLFHKPNSSLTNTLYARDSDSVSGQGETLHYEGEICFLIESNALVGVGFGLDLTKRSLQSKLKTAGLPWERAKAFRHSAVMSKFVKIETNHWQDLSLELVINSMRTQLGEVAQMIYKPDVILEEVQKYLDLEDGDILMTGTPSGVGEVHSGDLFTARIKRGDEVLLETCWKAQASIPR